MIGKILTGIDKALYKIPAIQKYCEKKKEAWIQQFEEDIKKAESALEKALKELCEL